jgi:hypothetical protein
MMVGMSHAVGAAKTVALEFLRIELRADGIFYVAPGPPIPPLVVCSLFARSIYN